MKIQEHIIERAKIIPPIIEINGEIIHVMNQSHTDNIVHLENNLNDLKEPCDAIITSKKGVFGTYTSDCVPIIIFHPKKSAIIHAGWKGITKRIIKKVFEELESLNIPKEECLVHIGPHIKKDSYFAIPKDLGGDGREDLFIKEFGENSIKKNNDKIFIDLSYCAKEECIGAKNIYIDSRCTFKKDLPSYFRDQTNMHILTTIDLSQ